MLTELELRNRVYEYAVEWAGRCFPHTWPKPKKYALRNPPSGNEHGWVAPKPLPFIGLTQTCTLIRTEFRPLWLTTHRFPLHVLNSYFKVFFPPPLRASQASDQARKRIESYNNPAGTLRLYINKDSFSNVDIMPVLKFRVRFPQYTIVPVSADPYVGSGLLLYLRFLINNTNPIWIRNVERHLITQVRLQPRNLQLLRIVVKESYVSGLASPLYPFGHHGKEEYAASLGLDGRTRVFRTGIDYS